RTAHQHTVLRPAHDDLGRLRRGVDTRNKPHGNLPRGNRRTRRAGDTTGHTARRGPVFPPRATRVNTRPTRPAGTAAAARGPLASPPSAPTPRTPWRTRVPA